MEIRQDLGLSLTMFNRVMCIDNVFIYHEEISKMIQGSTHFNLIAPQSVHCSCKTFMLVVNNTEYNETDATITNNDESETAQIKNEYQPEQSHASRIKQLPHIDPILSLRPFKNKTLAETIHHLPAEQHD